LVKDSRIPWINGYITKTRNNITAGI